MRRAGIQQHEERHREVGAVRLWQMDQKDANFKVLTWLKTHNLGCVDVKSSAGMVSREIG